jgi:glucose/arabinose dehydrogenase
MKIILKLITLVALVLTINTSNCQNINNLTLFASGITRPVGIVNAGDNRLFVVNQTGYIQIISPEGIVSSQPFIDIHNRIVYGGERGLLGMAFHPQFKTNGYFFVNYIGKGDSTHISRFKIKSDNPEQADTTSELKLMTIFQPYQNHNGGELCFGPDGYLYIGMGDGGSGGDPGNRAQNPKEYLGKMLRIDVDHGNTYSIPPTNPFYGSTNVLNEIWALGLRNPWRFSFDRLTGDLWIADVGQNAYEEIDFQPANSKGGENYGWKCYEGNQPFSNSGCVSVDQLTFPVYDYPQDPECSVTGGYVYRGSNTSPFYGHYFFTDYCTDHIWTLHKEANQWLKEDFGIFSGNSFSTFGEDVSGQLFVAGIKSGKIYRVVDQSTQNGFIQKPSVLKIINTPFSNKIRIESTNSFLGEIQISVYDIRGVNHYQNQFHENSFEFNVGFLPAGMYLLKVKVDGNSQIQKIVLGK